MVWSPSELTAAAGAHLLLGAVGGKIHDAGSTPSIEVGLTGVAHAFLGARISLADATT